MSNSHGADGNRAVDFQFFDRLPRSVKELLWYAPDSLSSASVVKTQRQWTLTPAELHEEWYGRIVNYRRRVILDSYGNNHPQLRGSWKTI